MKMKWLRLILALVLVLSMIAVVPGCGEKKPEEAKKTTASWEELAGEGAGLLSKTPGATDISGLWAGAMIITEATFPPAQEGIDDGCARALVESLKQKAIPVQFELKINEDGKGTFKMIDKEDPSSEQSVPAIYSNGKLTLNFPKDESNPTAVMKMEGNFTGITDRYRDSLKTRAAEQKVQAETITNEIKNLEAKLATSQGEEKTKIAKEIEQKKPLIEILSTGAIFLEQISVSKATLKMGGTFEQSDTVKKITIKGILTAVNAPYVEPKK
jgi:hypothetical protein